MAALTRICLIGAESTGKSELGNELAGTFSTVVVPEFAREYVLRVGRPLTYNDVEPIARGQIANEDRGIAEARGMILMDTDLVSTLVYSRYYYGKCPEWIEVAGPARLADLYLLMDIDIPWIADPARDPAANRNELHEFFKRALHAFGAHFVLISGTREERLARAIEAIQDAR